MEKPIEEIMINAKESKMSKFKEHQRVYVKGLDDKKWSWGCLTLDGKKCVLLSDSCHILMPLSKVRATPFKTELEIAKEKQLENLSIKYNYVKGGLFWGKVKSMQESGELAEIILPLED